MRDGATRVEPRTIHAKRERRIDYSGDPIPDTALDALSPNEVDWLTADVSTAIEDLLLRPCMVVIDEL